MRIDPAITKYIATRKKNGETLSATLRRLLAIPPKKGSPDYHIFYALPSDLWISAEEARGAAIIQKVQKKLVKAEKPVALKEIL